MVYSVLLSFFILHERMLAQLHENQINRELLYGEF